MSRSTHAFLFALASLLVQAEAAAGGVTGLNIMIIFVVGLGVLGILLCGYKMMCKPKSAQEMIGPLSGEYELHADHPEGHQVQIPVGDKIIGFTAQTKLSAGTKIWIQVDENVVKPYVNPPTVEAESAEAKVDLEAPAETGLGLGIFTWL